jgi:hypothetical protein
MNVFDEVKDILAEFEDARNSDIVLTSRLWKKFYPSHIHNFEGKNYIALESLTVVPMFDTISRARRIIQNDEYTYLPTKLEVAKARRINEDVWRKAMATKQITIFNKPNNQ